MQKLSHIFKILFREASNRGIVSLVITATGWVLVAIWIMPWLRDFMVTEITAGASPSIASVWPPPLLVISGTVIAIVMLSTGIILFSIWCHRHGGLGLVVEERLSTPGRLALAISIWTAIISVALLARGDPIIGDAKTHISRAWVWKESLKAAEIPVWTDLWYGGFPVGQHYSPLSHILIAIVSLTGISPYLAVKIVVWLLGIIGAVGFGIWCQSFFRSQQSGFLGGVIYSLLPTIDTAWLWHGRLPGVLVMAILPWAFYAVNKLADNSNSRRAASMLALCLVALTLTHTLQARLAFAILAVYSITEFVLRRRARLGWLLFGWCGGLTMSLLFIIPVYLERNFVNDITEPRIAVLSIVSLIPELARLAIHWNPRGDWYVGLLLIFLSALGLRNIFCYARRRDRSIRHAISSIGLIVTPWIFAYGHPREVEILYYGVAFTASASVVHLKGWRRSHMMLVAILLLLMDLGPANLISTYVARRDDKKIIYSNIESCIGSGRFLELPLDYEGMPKSSYWHFVPMRSVASVGGPFIQGAPKSFVYRAALIDTVASALANRISLSPRLVKILEIENVKIIGLSNTTTITAPSSQMTAGITLDSCVTAWRIQEASPVSVIDSLPVYLIKEAPKVKMGGIGKDNLNNRSVSRNVIEYVFSWMDSMDPTPVADVRLNRRPNAVDYIVPDVGGRKLRIALAAYPTLKVYIDGCATEWREGPLGGILIDVNPGSHKISIEGGMEKTRIVMIILLVLLVAGLFVLIIVP